MAAAAQDVDSQSIDNIPRETLVALLRRREKEAKTTSGKLEKLEERYVKVVRFNKILMEDRTSFLRFCMQLLPESGSFFEEAAAQEIPVNLEVLLKQLAAWRSSLEAAASDRRVLQQFAELVFPGDGEVDALFARETIGPDALDLLQQRWVALEDLHAQQMAIVNAMMREQVAARDRDHEVTLGAKRELEKRVAELREQITQLAREKAQSLLRSKKEGYNGSTIAPQEAPPDGGAAAAESALVTELRNARDQAERNALRAVEAAAEREAELERQLRDLKVRCQLDSERHRDDDERQRAQSRRLLEEKDVALEGLQKRVKELEKDSGNSFISRLAEQQAGRDVEVRAQQKQVERLQQTVFEVQGLLAMSYGQERVLKMRIRELEASLCRGNVNPDYLKHVILKFVQYAQRGDMKAQSLVPVIGTLLNLDAEERKSIEPVIPQPLQVFNQVVGDSVSWYRSSLGSTGNASTNGGELVSDAAGSQVLADESVGSGISGPDMIGLLPRASADVPDQSAQVSFSPHPLEGAHLAA